MTYVLVALLQIIFSVLKVFDVKWSYDNEIVKLTILNFVMSGVWIIGTALGVGAVIDGDIYMMVIYIVFGGIGKPLAIILFNNYNKTTYPKGDLS